LVAVARGGERHVGAGNSVCDAIAAAGQCNRASNRGEKTQIPETTGHGDLAVEGMGAANTADFMPTEARFFKR
jgi:hypothetical protein